MKDYPEFTIDQLCGVVEELPDGWDVLVEFSRGCLDVNLYDPTGERVDLCQDDMSFVEMFLDCINHARKQDGLCSKVDFDEHGNVETGYPFE